MSLEKLEKSIYELLPQIPYVIDQVGEAIKWTKEELKEGELNKALKVAYEVTEFASKISTPTFFKTHLVLASLLSNIPDVLTKERFSTFDTASKATEKAIQKLVVDPKKNDEYGCFKSVLVHLVPLAKEDETLFAVALIGIKYDLEEIVEGMKKADVKTPITAKDYVSILGYALVMANIRMANLKLLDRTYEIYNDIIKLLNGLNY